MHSGGTTTMGAALGIEQETPHSETGNGKLLAAQEIHQCTEAGPEQ